MRLVVWFLLQEIPRSEDCNEISVFTALLSQLPLDDMLKKLTSLDVANYRTELYSCCY
jgi:hypothetical protein